jgi:hypothetical protein
MARSAASTAVAPGRQAIKAQALVPIVLATPQLPHAEPVGDPRTAPSPSSLPALVVHSVGVCDVCAFGYFNGFKVRRDSLRIQNCASQHSGLSGRLHGRLVSADYRLSGRKKDPTWERRGR